MKFNDLEKILKRAFRHSFQLKKVLFAYPFLFLCGLVVVLFRSIAFVATNWIVFSLIFVPIFFSISIFSILGVILCKIYYNEVKNQRKSYIEIFKSSTQNIVDSLQITIPPFLIFLIFNLIFGLLVMIKEIPHVGSFIGSSISFLPFLLVLSTIAVCIISFLTIFFATPGLSIKTRNKIVVLKEAYIDFKKDLFTHIIYFLIGISAGLLVFLILFISIKLTKLTFVIPMDIYNIVFQWLSIMTLFVLFLTPFVIFFFNFSMEVYNFSQTKEKDL
ncbi:MAG: hypothetical protein WCT85_05810 [Parachlamydiales bacterium]|jgi:hypothetical protein